MEPHSALKAMAIYVKILKCGCWPKKWRTTRCGSYDGVGGIQHVEDDAGDSEPDPVPVEEDVIKEASTLRGEEGIAASGSPWMIASEASKEVAAEARYVPLWSTTVIERQDKRMKRCESGVLGSWFVGYCYCTLAES